MSRPSSGLQLALSVVLTLAAVTIAVAAAKQVFFQSTPPPPVQVVETAPRPEPDWDEIVRVSIPAVGGPNARALLIEFVDIECPFCRRFHVEALQAARERFGDQLAVAYVHWPLPNHRFARPGAEAAECAGRQAGFGALIDVLFAKQDSLGLKPWTSYASDANVVDTLAFASCLRDPAAVAGPIDAGIALAQARGYTGTPTILLNGWRFPVPPTPTRLLNAIQAVLDGNDPGP